jgi:hypothetical protein
VRLRFEHNGFILFTPFLGWNWDLREIAMGFLLWVLVIEY